MTVESGPSPEDVLASNRDGRLTESQRSRLSVEERARRRIARAIALLLLLFAAYIAFMPGIDPSGATRYVFLLGCIGVAVVLIFRSLFHVSSLTRDLREGKVLSFEGALDRSMASESDRDTSQTIYRVDIGDKGFSIDRTMYRAVFNGTYLRVFYLPHSCRVVSYEPLGHSAAVGGPSILNFFASLGTGVVSRNPSTIEDVADIGRPAIGGLDEYVYEHPIASAEVREADTEDQSLAGAMVGSWMNSVMTVTFDANGTVDAVTIGGFKRWGYWSIDTDGHLHSDILGKDAALDARVAGNQLTLSLDGTEIGLTLDRVTS